MNLLDGMKKKNTILNKKGSEYFSTSFDSNLDMFTLLTRFSDENTIVTLFKKALLENEELAIANLLYILDIRNGKGERRLFQIMFKYLCNNNRILALKVLSFISELGRFDYILIGIDTLIEKEVVSLIKEQLNIDINSDSPSLLAKWLPSHRSYGHNNLLAKKLIKLLNISEREYRKTLSDIRSKINIVEKNLTDRNYYNIDFEKVPSKAMMKYRGVFQRNMTDEFSLYVDSVKEGKSKINTSGLFAYEIVKKILVGSVENLELCNLMWENQKDILSGVDTNLLVVADTSGSMCRFGLLPISTSIGLAIYIAQRNKGFFKDHYITFSEKPVIQKICGNNICEIISNMEEINCYNTDIDKVFELILNSAIENKLSQKDLPSHIMIISDMEFDRGVKSIGGTNFDGWIKMFEEVGYKLPKIIFWNVAGNASGVPVTKYEKDVVMVSGFSTNILNNLLELENYTPVDIMMESLSKYLEMLK